MAIDSLYSFQHGWSETTRSQHCFETRVVFSPVVDIQDVKRDLESTLHGTAQIGVEIEILYRGFHAQGAVLLPEYLDGVKDDTEHGDKPLQQGFVELLQSCHSVAVVVAVAVAVAESNVLAKLLIAVLVTQRNSLYFPSLAQQMQGFQYITIMKKSLSRVMGQMQQTYMALMKVPVLRV
jgi:hypothetical protein